VDGVVRNARSAGGKEEREMGPGMWEFPDLMGENFHTAGPTTSYISRWEGAKQFGHGQFRCLPAQTRWVGIFVVMEDLATSSIGGPPAHRQGIARTIWRLEASLLEGRTVVKWSRAETEKRGSSSRECRRNFSSARFSQCNSHGSLRSRCPATVHSDSYSIYLPTGYVEG